MIVIFECHTQIKKNIDLKRPRKQDVKNKPEKAIKKYEEAS